MELMQTTPKEKEEILRFYNKTPTTVKDDVKTVKDWMCHQQLRPQDDLFIELILLKNKFNIERAKRKLTFYFKTIQSNGPIFKKLGQFKPSRQLVIAICFPKLTPNLERVGLMKVIDPDISKFDFADGMMVTYTLAYLLVHRDYSLASRIIVDFDGCTLHHFLKLNPIIAFKFMQIYEQVFSSKVNGIEILNAPAFITGVLNLAKMVIKPKLLARITIHENLESLHGNIPKEFLPSDYGGGLLSIKDYLNIYDKVLLDEQTLFTELRNLLPVEEINGNLEFGAVGSFKKLNID